MKKNALVIAIYALLLLVGGLIGLLKANSYASLIASGSFSILLFGCSYFTYKGNAFALNFAMGVQALLLLFFCYRFSLSYQIMPAGLMIAVTSLSLLYFFSKKGCLTCKK